MRIAADTSEDTDVREAIAGQLVAAGFGLLGLHSQSMSLEDVFVRLVTEETAGE